MTYYAQTNFRTKINEWGQVEESLKPGDEVDAGKLGISDEEFQELINTGAVSEEEYPDVPDGMSPAEYERSKLALESAREELEMHVAELEASSGSEAETEAEAAPKKEAAKTPAATPAASSSSSSSSSSDS